VDAVVTFTACDTPNEVTFEGAITTNGPATVTYHWEVSGDEQEITLDKTIDFAVAGVQKPTDFVYSADCGNYSITLRVTDPTETFAEKMFKIQAP